MLIDETGKNLGNLPTQEALALAEERGLDLVEVSPLANPPVAKIVNYSKLRYQEERERRKEKAKQKKVEVKGLRLSLRIGQGDKDVRVKQALKFLSQGDKVRMEITLRGRERQHTDLAKQIINKFVNDVRAEMEINVEQHLEIQGGKLTILIAKK